MNSTKDIKFKRASRKKSSEDLNFLNEPILELPKSRTDVRPSQHNSCPRCQGLMAPESCFNLNYDAGEMEILTWRCLQCGELVDPVILRNRENPPEKVGRRKPRPMLPTLQRTSRKEK